MKVFFCLLVFLCWSPVFFAQCPTGDVELYTQEEVDGFLEEHSSCATIAGDLLIGSSVTDLSGLTQVKRIEGDLIIISALTNLNNFSKLEFVGGHLTITSNNSLIDLSGFNGLIEVRGDLEITQNASLLNINGFNNLKVLGGTLQLQGNRQVEEFKGFNSLETVGGHFYLGGLGALAELRGFNNLQSVGERFEIYSNDSLELIDGFNSLKSIGSVLHLWENNCKIIRGFGSLQSIGGGLSLQGFYEEIPQFNALTFLGGGIEFSGLNVPDLSGFNNLVTIGGWFLLVQNEGLQRITGFRKLREIKGVLQFLVNPSLESIKGLGNLQVIGGLLQINENASLRTLEGLESLIKVADQDFINDNSFLVTNNASLIDCSAICDLLTGDGITGRIVIQNNPNACSSREEITAECGNKITLCVTDDPIDLFTVLKDGETLGGSWNPATNAGNGIFDPGLDAPGIYIYSFDNGDGEATVEVLVNEAPEAGENEEVIFCTSTATIDLLQHLGGSPDPGGIWTLNGNTVSSAYSLTGLNAGKYEFEYTVSGGGCDDATAILTLVLERTPYAGTPASLALCEQDPPTNLLDQLGTGVDPNGSWSPSLSGPSGTFNPAVDLPGIYTYSIQSANCGKISAEVRVEVFQKVNAGEDGSMTFCAGDPAVDLFSLLKGDPQPGGSWQVNDTDFSGWFDPSQHAAANYTYTVTSSSCGTQSATLEIIVMDVPFAGKDASFTTCSSAGLEDLFGLLGPDAQAGGTWSPVLNSGSGIFDPSVDPQATYTYTVGNNTCGRDSAQVSIQINDTPNAGRNTGVTICSTTPSFDLLSLVEGNPDRGGQWNPPLAGNGDIFNPTLDSGGLFTYTVGSGTCGTASSQIEIEVLPVPYAGLDATLEICSNESPVDLFSLLQPGAQAGGSWSPTLASGTGVFDPYVDEAGTYTYTVGTSLCGTSEARVEVAFLAFSPLEDYSILTTEMGLNNGLEINTPQGREFQYSINGVDYQTSRFFHNLDGGEYTVHIRETGGCGYAVEKVLILAYPKFFSPNNDGYNDFWALQGTKGKEYSLIIYDRYGKVLKQLKTGESWDGYFNGRPLPQDDYWFDAQFKDGFMKKGNFSLLR